MAAGQLLTATDDDSSYSSTYDNTGRMTKVDNNGTPNAPNVVLESEHDKRGSRTKLQASVDGTEDFETICGR